MTDRPDGVDQFTVCTRHCGARCCGYITVSIATPLAEQDWDEIRWWLTHEGIMVTKDEDGWMVHAEARCRNLRADKACGIYEARPTVCAEYEPETCEYAAEVEFDVRLESEEDLADYLERRKLKRGARVARAIRAAAPLKRALRRSSLVQLQGLPSSRNGRAH
jgi:Fe-S-cluster containining protein